MTAGHGARGYAFGLSLARDARGDQGRQICAVPGEQWISERVEDRTDALVYLGPASTKTEAPLPREICSDTTFVQIQLQRMAIAGLPPSEPDGLRKLCGLDR